MQLPKHHCERCEHDWLPRKVDASGNVVPPKNCPKCNSPSWNKPRRSETQ